MAHCGCYYKSKPRSNPVHLPRVAVNVHATILSSISRTVLTQTYINPSKNLIKEVLYGFPLYDGVSVVGFRCQVGSRILKSRVHPRKQAKAKYDNAVGQGQSAALMDQSLHASDVFSIKLGNVQPEEKVVIEISFVGELRQDAQTNGIRYTIPNSIAPRYGNQPKDMELSEASQAQLQGIAITVDVQMEKAAVIREIQSPSHTISVSLGRVSGVSDTDTTFNPSQASASASLTQDTALLSDFVLLVKADGLDTPRAMLETHPVLHNQRAIMATLVPKFHLTPSKPEMVFVIDRSGSMDDKIQTLQSALRVFLKSLPLGVCFNICSFGSSFSFLWKQSRVYDAVSLQDALAFTDTVDADMGGTEMQQAVEAAVHSRLKNKDLEVLILTDGQIWNERALFNFVRDTAADGSARFFSLGIGNEASHSLIEGIARAGNGFSQSVVQYEELDRKVVRMLKGALTPHIGGYKLEVEYEGAGEEFEVVMHDPPPTVPAVEDAKMEEEQQPISLFDSDYKEPEDETMTDANNLPTISPPGIIQAPHKIPPLYPFIRTTIYLLLNPETTDQTPKSLILKATSKQGPLHLRIPIDDIGKGETIHQLASRKAMLDLEEGDGWLCDAEYNNGIAFRSLHHNTKRPIIAQQCEDLGTRFQVTGKHCSFVALEADENDSSQIEKEVKAVSIRSPKTPLQQQQQQQQQQQPLIAIMPQMLFSSSVAAHQSVCRKRAKKVSRFMRDESSDESELEAQRSFAPVHKSEATSTVHRIIALQSFEGFWGWSSDVMSVLGMDEADLRDKLVKAFEKRGAEVGYDDAVVATMLVMGYLRAQCVADQSVWELVYDKAEEWVKLRLAEMGEKGRVLEEMKSEIMSLI